MLSVNWKLETFSVKAEPLFRQLYLHQIFYSKTLHLKPLLRQKGVTKNLNIFHRGLFESFRATPTAEAIWQIHLCEKLTETCKKYRMEFGCGFVQSFTVFFFSFFLDIMHMYMHNIQKKCVYTKQRHFIEWRAIDPESKFFCQFWRIEEAIFSQNMRFSQVKYF